MARRIIELQFDAQGFAVDGMRASWDDVESIVTYKLDLLTTDCIVVAIWVAGGHGYLLNEEDCGAALIDLMSHARQRFPTIPEDWYFTVMLPAFATNYRVLWHKPGTTLPPAPAAPRDRSTFAELVIVIVVLGGGTAAVLAIWLLIKFIFDIR